MLTEEVLTASNVPAQATVFFVAGINNLSTEFSLRATLGPVSQLALVLEVLVHLVVRDLGPLALAAGEAELVETQELGLLGELVGVGGAEQRPAVAAAALREGLDAHPAVHAFAVPALACVDSNVATAGAREPVGHPLPLPVAGAGVELAHGQDFAQLLVLALLGGFHGGV